MTISKDLLLSILSLDAYNRGYGAGIDSLGGAGTKVGAALIRNANLPTDSQAAAFYAVSYTVGEGVDGIDAGTTVISYRGTDNFGNLEDGMKVRGIQRGIGSLVHCHCCRGGNPQRHLRLLIFAKRPWRWITALAVMTIEC